MNNNDNILYKWNILYLAMDFNNNWRVNTFYNEEDISKYKKEYNIYKSVNTFISNNRRIKDLYEFLWIWIDIDDNISEEILWKRIENLNWLMPKKINKTYKWYHVYFSFSPELYLISKKNYELIWHKINSILKWDVFMKSITWILKVEWTIDFKDDRNFEIYNIYDSHNYINKNLLSFFIKSNNLNIRRIKYRNINLEEKNKKKGNKKERNNSLVENLCALKIINKINEYHNQKREWFNKKIEFINKTNKNISIKWYSWLKLYYNKNNNKWEFKDYTISNNWEKRYWNMWFLQNFYFKDEQDKFVLLNKFLYSSFWIILNKNVWDTAISEQLSLAFIKKDLQLEFNSNFQEEYNNLVWYNNDLLDKYWNSSIKLFIWLINFLNEQNQFRIIKRESFTFKAKDFLKYLWISYWTYNIKLMRKNFLILSSMKIPDIVLMDIWDWKKKEFIKYQHFMVFSETSKEEGTRYYNIDFNIPNFSKIIYINKWLEKLDKWLWKNNNTMLWFKVKIALSKFPKYYISNKELWEVLGFSIKRMDNKKDFNREINKISKLIVKNNIAINYEIKDKGVYYYKYKN